MKKFIKISIIIILTLLSLEVSSRVFIFSYLRKNIPEEEFNALFYKSTFFYYIGALFCEDSMYEYDFMELTHLKANSRLDINEDGYRGEKVSIAKPKNTFRILCLGDSTTFGLCIPVEHTYPYLLQDKLQAEFPELKIEVLNAGVPSTNSIEAKRRYQVKFTHYNPDIILWRSGFDLTDNLELPKITIGNKITLLIKKRIVRSCLVNLILIPLKTSTYFDYPNKRVTVAKGITSNYHLVKILAEKQGAKVIAVDWIRRNLKTEELTSAFTNHKPINEDYIDTLTALKRSGHPSKALLFNDAHLTALGNDILAETIANYLLNKNLMPSMSDA